MESKHAADLQSFLPRDLILNLQRGKLPQAESVGAALFVDISGFTPMTRGFIAEFGRNEGAERLSSELARVFQVLCQAIQDHGGSVVSFAGDAISCWIEHADLAVAARRAVAAALHAKAHIDLLTFDRYPIDIKVGIAIGQASRFVLGQADIQLLLCMSGTPVDQAAAAEKQAEPGDIIVTAELADVLGDELHVVDWRDAGRVAVVRDLRDASAQGQPAAALPFLSESQLRPWLIKPVADQILEGRGAFLGGVRNIAVLFLQFDFSTGAGREWSSEKLNGFVCKIQQIARELDGHLIDINFGDKGSYLNIAFGAIREHEDDGSRALASALKILQLKQDIPELAWLSIGVAEANVYAGSYGGQNRRTFGLVGEDIILAARLMQQAQPDEILVGPGLSKKLDGLYRLQRLPARELKGFDEPVAPSRLLGERVRLRPTLPSSSQFFGRRAELAQLLAQLQTLQQDGTGGRVCLEGEAGIGKSGLLEQVNRHCALLNLPCFWGPTDSVHQNAPYYPWRPIFESVLGLGGDDGEPMDVDQRIALCEHRLRALDERLPRLMPLLNPVLGLSLPDNSFTRSLEGAVRSDNTQELLLKILANMREPFALMLEDLHWFDSASMGLLQLVASDVQHALIVMTRRPPSAESPTQPLPRDVQVLKLGALDQDDASQLIRQTLMADSLAPGIAEWIISKAQGSPFHCRELSLALRDTGALQIASGHAQLAHGLMNLDQLDFPDTIQGVIAARLEQLPGRQQLAIKVASVIGREFRERMLREVHPVQQDHQSLGDSLTRLQQSDLLNELPQEDERAYLFSHVLTRDVAYSRLLMEQKALLHHAIGEWIEAHPTGHIARDLPLLAHHFSAAAKLSETLPEQVRLKALDYLTQAGQQSLQSYMNREAVRFFSDAIELAPVSESSARRTLWHASLAHAHLGLGEFPQSQQHARQAFRLLGMAFPQSKLGIALDSLRHSLLVFPRVALNRLHFADTASAVPGESFAPPDDPLQLLRVFAKSKWHDNDILSMYCANMRSVRIARNKRANAETALSQAHLMMTLDVFGMNRQADQFARQAMETACALQCPATQVAVHIATGMVKLGGAHWVEARCHFEAALEQAAALGDESQWGEAQAILADIDLMQGRVESASQRYTVLEAKADRRDVPLQKSWCLRPQAIGLLAGNQAGEALQLCQAWDGYLRRGNDPLMQLDWLGFQCLAHVQLNQPEQAIGVIAQALEIIPAVSPPVAYPRFFGYRAMSEAGLLLLEQQPDDSKRRDLASKIQKYLTQYAQAFRYARPRAQIVRAWRLAIQGRAQQAGRLMRDAAALAQALGLEPDRALAESLQRRFGL